MAGRVSCGLSSGREGEEEEAEVVVEGEGGGSRTQSSSTGREVDIGGFTYKEEDGAVKSSGGEAGGHGMA